MFNPQATLLEILDPEQNTTFKEPLRNAASARGVLGMTMMTMMTMWCEPPMAWEKRRLRWVRWCEKTSLAWSLFGNIRKSCWDMMLTSNSDGISPIMFSRFCFLRHIELNISPWLISHLSTLHQDHYLNTPFDLPRPRQWHRPHITISLQYQVNSLGLQYNLST